ncbi:MAG TPA: short-chain fatty acyl-CoA regulator family protein, partial [Thermoanaerobaculia bacterium]
HLDAAVPIGTTCRLCERLDCDQRAFPPLQHAVTVDENVRGRSFYAPVEIALPETNSKLPVKRGRKKK